jgi:putative phosphoribosyl transferase
MGADYRSLGGYEQGVFRDRVDAGDRLAEELARLDLYRPVVLGLARGGVEVASRVAARLLAPLDVLVVRKIGHPEQPELGLGAVSEGGIEVIDERAARLLDVSKTQLESIASVERHELERRVAAYRDGRRMIDVAGRTAVLVDDGIATGMTMRAAVATGRAKKAGRVVVAAPVGSPDIVNALRAIADVVCVETPTSLGAVGAWYQSFEQLTDGDVVRALGQVLGGHPGEEWQG